MRDCVAQHNITVLHFITPPRRPQSCCDDPPVVFLFNSPRSHLVAAREIHQVGGQVSQGLMPELEASC